MKVVVIGGSGHIGTFLVPRLVRAGHEVINVSRGVSKAYVEAPEWLQVRQVIAEREQEDRDGTFGERIAALQADAVIDLVCFTLESAAALVSRLRGEAGHLVHCGSIWRYGPSRKLPIAEGSDLAAAPFGNYGIQKDNIARMLKEETATDGLATTSLHPGHIVGPGWHPIGPLGSLDPAVWHTLSAGQPLQVPGSGSEVMHHVHADDLAQAFEKAIERRDAAVGEDFNIVAPTALTVRGYADIAAGWFGQQAVLETVTWERFREITPPEHADAAGATCTATTASPLKRPGPSWAMRPGTSPKRPCSNPCGGSSNTMGLGWPARSTSRPAEQQLRIPDDYQDATAALAAAAFLPIGVGTPQSMGISTLINSPCLVGYCSMARKRRRSGSAAAAGAGASGCGPLGFFLALCVIGLIVQYWWVLFISIGVVALTVALVRKARTPAPPATARQAKPIRTPEPQAPVSEDLAAQLRANKHVRHVRSMQEWDYEWIRLTHPGKSSREVGEIANALFARGWSAGASITDTPPSPRPKDP